MDDKVLEQLAAQARSDPAFFHALVFDTEKVLAKLDYLDRSAKASLVAISPEEIIGILVGKLNYCGFTCSDSCGFTCGAGSCGHTTSLVDRGSLVSQAGRAQYCGDTCMSSCGYTCGSSSCGHTTDFSDIGDRVNPAFGRLRR